MENSHVITIYSHEIYYYSYWLLNLEFQSQLIPNEKGIFIVISTGVSWQSLEYCPVVVV